MLDQSAGQGAEMSWTHHKLNKNILAADPSAPNVITIY